MEPIYWIRNWFANLFRPKGMHDDLAEEMEHHLSMSVEKKVAEGLSPEEARREALKEFGAVERIKEECHDAWGTRMIMDTVADLRFAFRQLRKSKGFLAVVLLTIAICSGLNVAVYSYAHSLIIKPFDYPNGDEVVAVGKIWRKQSDKVGYVSPLSFVEIEREAKSFKAIGLIDSDDSVDVSIDGGAAFATDIMLVSGGVWEAVGVRPILGRTFSPESVEDGHDKVVVLSFALWQSRFEGGADVVGRKIRLNGAEHTILGVMPERFNILYPNQMMWAPRIIRSHELKEANRESNGNRVVARLKSGVSLSQAQVELDQLFDRTFDSHPEQQAAWARSGLSYTALPLKEFVTKNEAEMMVPATTVLQVVVLCVLAIGCLNVAGLTLVRGMTRLKEISMRASLGANRGRIVRQLLTESLLLFILGGMASIPFAFLAIEWLHNIIFQDLHIPKASMNLSVFVFAGLVLLSFGLLFGWLPARSTIQSGLSHTISESDGRASAGAGRGRLQQALMVCQIGLACCLLILAVTLVRNGFAVVKEDYGFISENRTLVKVGLPSYLYPDTPSRRSFFSEARDRLAQLPGVHNVAYTNRVPLTSYNMWYTEFSIVGKPLAPDESARQTTMFRVSPDFFSTMGITLLKGRLFNESDHQDSQPVVIIDEQNAQDYFEDRDPIGSTIRFWNKECRVVGVVSKTINMPYFLESPLDRALYFPHAQWSPMRPASFVVHSSLDKGSLERAIQKLVREINPQLLQIQIDTLQEIIADSAKAEITFAKLTALFSALAYALTLIGIYGVVSNTVTQKIKEIGIRIAIGARVYAILLLFLRSASLCTILGLMLGLVPAYFALKILEPYLNGVGALDPWIFLGVAFSILVCSLIASLAPVYRAATILPTETLRYE